MRISQGTLLELLRNSAVELRFARRRDKFGWSSYRRMLCCNDFELLNSAPGQIALHFKPPSLPPPYPWITKNLVCAWDIFFQDWRMISVESCDMVTAIPTKPPEPFWLYFNEYLSKMSMFEKVGFMNR